MSGQAVAVAVRPEKMSLHREPPREAPTGSPAQVWDIGYLGDWTIYRVKLDDGRRSARLARQCQPLRRGAGHLGRTGASLLRAGRGRYPARDDDPSRRTRSPSASAAPSFPALPFLWLALFFLVPFLIVLKISLSDPAIAQPPYRPVLAVSAGLEGLRAFLAGLDLETSATLLADDLYLGAALSSLRIALVRRPILLLVGYPIAYAMAPAPARWRPLLVALVILPFWTSFLIRVYAWIGILRSEGLLNQALLALGIIAEPLDHPQHGHGRLYRHRLRVSAVHGAAALRHPRAVRRHAHRGGRRISARRRGRRSGRSPCRYPGPASRPVRSCASSRSSASSSCPTCSAGPRR